MSVTPARQAKTNGAQYANPTGHSFGLTKREHIAALALQGLLANQSVSAFATVVACAGEEDAFGMVARSAARLADALLAALEEVTP